MSLYKQHTVHIVINLLLFILIISNIRLSGLEYNMTSEKTDTNLQAEIKVSALAKETEIVPPEEKEINLSKYRQGLISSSPLEVLEIEECKAEVQKDISTYAISDYSFIQLNGNISKQNYDLMISRYVLIPINVRESFQKSGWKITLTTERLEETWFNYLQNISVCAGTDSGLQEIRLENTKNGAKAVVHEVGHYVQTLMTPDEFTEWEKIYADEYGNMTNYAKSSSWEAFAECFEELYVNPKAIGDCPGAKDFIYKVVSRITC